MKRSRRTGLQQPLPLLGLMVLLFVAWTLLQQDEPGKAPPLLPAAATPEAPSGDATATDGLPEEPPTRLPPAPVATDLPAPEVPTDAATADEPAQDLMLDASLAVLDEVNALRREAGLPELQMAPALLASAQAHSADMAAGDFCDHQGSDGRNATERMRAAGFNGVFTGENIACGNKTAAQAVASWTDDDLHRDNVLGPRYRYAGVGVAPGRYGPSWTLDLGSD
ncbi:MAG: CAP domain-containing protein [Ardenticatenia bacterium]|nr:CAP domain-containing protein [Ardenticatenia bacterium]